MIRCATDAGGRSRFLPQADSRPAQQAFLSTSDATLHADALSIVGQLDLHNPQAAAFGFEQLWTNVFVFVLALPLVGDIACALFHRRGLSLHDMFFRTQVMLDVRPFEQTERVKREKQEEEEYWERRYWSPLKREVQRLRTKRHL